MAEKPSQFHEWDVDKSHSIEPSLTTKNNGYPPRAAMPTEHYNWMWWLQDKWNKFFDYMKVNKTRRINPGNGLSGGGDLSADRSLSVRRKDYSINVESTGISVNRSNDYSHPSASADVLMTQAGAKGLYNRTVNNQNAINNNSDKIENLLNTPQSISFGKGLLLLAKTGIRVSLAGTKDIFVGETTIPQDAIPSQNQYLFGICYFSTGIALVRAEVTTQGKFSVVIVDELTSVPSTAVVSSTWGLNYFI